MPETITYPKLVKSRTDHKCSFCCQPIPKGTIYNHAVYKHEGVIYSWKSHEACIELVGVLDMHDFDDGDGITSENFIETVKEEYCQIMKEHHNEEYESKDFITPKFSEQLQFVIKHQNLKNTK